MCMTPDAIILAQETILQSERDSAKRIYWAPASTYQAFRGCTAIDIEWFVHSKLNTPTVQFYAQISVDGKSWEDLPNTSTNGFVGSNISNTDVGDRDQTTLWLGGMLAKASYVRFGVQIQGSSTQAEMCLTLKVTPRCAGGDVFITDSYTIDSVTSPVDVGGPVIDVRDAKSVTFYGSATGMTASNTVADFEIYTSNKPSGTFTGTGVRLQLVEPTADPYSNVAVNGGDSSNFMSYIKLYQVQQTSGTPSSAGTLTMYATVRPNR